MSFLLLLFVGVVSSQTLSSCETRDSNADGYLDAVFVTFTTNVQDASVTTTLAQNGVTLVGYEINYWDTDIAGDNKGYFRLYQLLSLDTGNTPMLSFKDTNSGVSSVQCADKAPPVWVALLPSNSTGDLPTLFSEAIGDKLSQPNFVLNNTACGPGLKALQIGGATITTNNIVLLESTVVFTRNVGCTVVTPGSTSIQDTAGNLIVPFRFTFPDTKRFVQRAVFSYSFVDLDANGYIDAVQVTSVQPIYDASFSTALFLTDANQIFTTPNRQILSSTTGAGSATVVTNDRFWYFNLREDTSTHGDTGTSWSFTINRPANQYDVGDWTMFYSSAGDAPSDPNNLQGHPLGYPSNQALLDGAAPVVRNASMFINAGVYQVIIISFTENLKSASAVLSAFSASSFTVDAAVAQGDDTVVLQLSGGPTLPDAATLVAERTVNHFASTSTVVYTAPYASRVSGVGLRDDAANMVLPFQIVATVSPVPVLARVFAYVTQDIVFLLFSANVSKSDGSAFGPSDFLFTGPSSALTRTVTKVDVLNSSSPIAQYIDFVIQLTLDSPLNSQFFEGTVLSHVTPMAVMGNKFGNVVMDHVTVNNIDGYEGSSSGACDVAFGIHLIAALIIFSFSVN